MSSASRPLSVLSVTAGLLTRPHAWVDPEWRKLLAIPPDLPDSLTSRLIAYRANLPPVTLADLTHPYASWFTALWSAIPALVYLTGARCLRAEIFARNAWRHLSYGADGFLALPLPIAGNSPAMAMASEFDLEGEIRTAGQYCIEQALTPNPGWRARLSLRLAPVQRDCSIPPASIIGLSQSLCRQLLDCAISFHEKSV